VVSVDLRSNGLAEEEAGDEDITMSCSSASNEFLEELHLMGNNFLYALPSIIWQFTALKKLYVDNCNLSMIDEAVGRLVGIEILDFSGNNLTTIPESIGSLANLQKLNLFNNSLASLPDIFSNLKNLKELDLRMNQLTELPESISELDSLQWLYVASNQLKSLPPSVCCLKSLEVLMLSDNKWENEYKVFLRGFSIAAISLYLRALYLYAGDVDEERKLREKRVRRFEWEIEPQEIEKEGILGAGKFGIVYKCKWKGKDCACKLQRIPESSANDYQKQLELYARFCQEVGILSWSKREFSETNQLCKSNGGGIIEFEGACTLPENSFILMEWIPFGSLRERIYPKERRSTMVEIKFDTATKFKVMIAVVNTLLELSRVQRRTFIHSDLHSRNIFVLNRECDIRLGDFGLSKVSDVFSNLRINEPDHIGTMFLPIAAPEIIRSGEFSEKSDVFSCGILMYEMFTSKEIWEGLPPHSISEKVTSGSFPELGRQVPIEVAELIQWCWKPLETRPTLRHLKTALLFLSPPKSKLKKDLQQKIEIANSSLRYADNQFWLWLTSIVDNASQRLSLLEKKIETRFNE